MLLFNRIYSACSISSNCKSGLRDDIHQVFFDGWQCGRLDSFGRHKVHFATEQIFEIKLQTNIIRPGCPVKLNQNINVTTLPQAASCSRTKQRQRFYAITLERLAVGLDCGNEIITSGEKHIKIIRQTTLDI